MSEETQGLSMPSLGVQGKGRSNLPGMTVGEGESSVPLEPEKVGITKGAVACENSSLRQVQR